MLSTYVQTEKNAEIKRDTETRHGDNRCQHEQQRMGANDRKRSHESGARYHS